MPAGIDNAARSVLSFRVGAAGKAGRPPPGPPPDRHRQTPFNDARIRIHPEMIRETVEALKKAEAEAAELVAEAQRQAREKRLSAEQSEESFRNRFESEAAHELKRFSARTAAEKENRVEALRKNARQELEELDRQAAGKKKTAAGLLRKTLLDG